MAKSLAFPAYGLEKLHPPKRYRGIHPKAPDNSFKKGLLAQTDDLVIEE